ncbi:MAG: hypothetical protein HY328_07490 [Chloroflexi bacterium]|nr:hypothetical protein [Chloroflexota bacterium]
MDEQGSRDLLINIIASALVMVVSGLFAWLLYDRYVFDNGLPELAVGLTILVLLLLIAIIWMPTWLREVAARIGAFLIRHPRLFLLCLSLGLTAVIVSAILVLKIRVSEPSPTVSLISAQYRVNNWNQRLIDLRQAETSGLPVVADSALGISDFWVYVPERTPDTEIKIEVYDDASLTPGRLLGATEPVSVTVGSLKVGDLSVMEKHLHPDSEYPNHLKVQSAWLDDYLYVVVKAYRPNSSWAVVQVSRIRLKSSGAAWIVEPPYAHFASVGYSVNGGATQYLDLSAAREVGVNASPGDYFTVTELALHVVAVADVAIPLYVEGDVQMGAGFEKSTYQNSDPIRLDARQAGIVHPDEFSRLTWLLPITSTTVTLKIVHGKTQLDFISMNLNGADGADGLVRSSEAVRWPVERVRYLDFEKPKDIQSWVPLTGTRIALTTTQAFSGQSSLAVTVSNQPETLRGQAQWNSSFRADVIIGQVFWPIPENSEPVWAQVCVNISPHCFNILDKERIGEWQPFFIPLKPVSDNASGSEDLSDILWEGLYFQGWTTATSEQTYTFFLDGIQILPAD